jgi:hypothetical protein
VTECTWCAKKGSDRELGSVCWALLPGGGLCPGMMENAEKLKRDRDLCEIARRINPWDFTEIT